LLIFNRKSISITALGYLLLCLFRGSYLADAIYKKLANDDGNVADLVFSKVVAKSD
jgi:hypothetical protein